MKTALESLFYSLYCLERLYKEASNAQAKRLTMRRLIAAIYERFAARTQPLVVLAHPSVVTNNPGKGASFYYPAAP
jgi:hypothetical protein